MPWLWTLPDGDADFPGCWRAIGVAFSKSVRIGELHVCGAILFGIVGLLPSRYRPSRVKITLRQYYAEPIAPATHPSAALSRP